MMPLEGMHREGKAKVGEVCPKGKNMSPGC